MIRIAHLTDLHLLEDEPGRRSTGDMIRLRFVGFGRKFHVTRRKRRVAQALVDARAAGAEHVLITGDLTEDGTPDQFESLAEILHHSPYSAEEITLVPGNHDRYADPKAYERALDGPLRAFSRTSQRRVPLVFSDCAILPVFTTSIRQHYTRSAGVIDLDELETIRKLAGDSGLRKKPLVIAQHHPPVKYMLPPVQWVDGLQNAKSTTEILKAHEHLFVLHGHVHQAYDRRVAPHRPPQVFCSHATVARETALRLYDVGARFCTPVEHTSSIGKALSSNAANREARATLLSAARTKVSESPISVTA